MTPLFLSRKVWPCRPENKSAVWSFNSIYINMEQFITILILLGMAWVISRPTI